MGANALLDWKARAGVACPFVCCKCAWYSVCKIRRSAPTLAMAAFEGEVPIRGFSTARSWIAGGPAPWAKAGGAAEPRTHVTAPSAKRRLGREFIFLGLSIMDLLSMVV